MTASQLHALLVELALQYENDGHLEEAKGLRILAEVFDGARNQKVVKILDEIRQVRRLNSGART